MAAAGAVAVAGCWAAGCWCLSVLSGAAGVGAAALVAGCCFSFSVFEKWKKEIISIF